MRWADLDMEVRALLSGAQSSALIVAPFIKEAALVELLDCVGSDVRLEVFTRWRPIEVATGVSDTSILRIVEDRGGSLGLVDELHAKLFAADGKSCLVGSANVTAAGLGTSSKPNLEILHLVQDCPGSLALFLGELRKRARAATEEERQEVEKQAAIIKPNLPQDREPDSDAAVEDQRPEDPQTASGWIPTFRSPDRLYRLYSDADWLLSASAGEPALADLVALRIPGDLDRESFNSRVRNSLLASAGVKLIDQLLSEPQRFGAVSAALRDALPDATHAERQTAAQTLIRWLLHFAPDLYRVDTPNYSEILSRR